MSSTYTFTGVPSVLHFPGGYCTFEGSSLDAVPHYFTTDYQGNVRIVSAQDGTVEQVTNYYPFGAPYSDGTSTSVSLQPHKYNGKELDMTHGWNTYDYGARIYDPILCQWTSPDPLTGEYPWMSPYVYCGNNPIKYVDPDGKEPIYNTNGDRLGFTKDGFLGSTGMIYVYKGDRTDINWNDYYRSDLTKEFGDEIQNADHYIYELMETPDKKGTFLSNVASDIMKEYDGFVIEYNNKSYTFHLNDYGNKISYLGNNGNFSTKTKTSGEIVLNIGDCYESYELNGFNIVSTLLYHEWFGHAIMNWGDEKKNHHKCFEMVMSGKFFKDNFAQRKYKQYINKLYEDYKKKELSQP